MLLMAGITAFTAAGNQSVERLFKYVTLLLYGTYGTFLALSLSRFGPQIKDGFALPVSTDGWIDRKSVV